MAQPVHRVIIPVQPEASSCSEAGGVMDDVTMPWHRVVGLPRPRLPSVCNKHETGFLCVQPWQPLLSRRFVLLQHLHAFFRCPARVCQLPVERHRVVPMVARNQRVRRLVGNTRTGY